jgi:hypothetical protein
MFSFPCALPRWVARAKYQSTLAADFRVTASDSLAWPQTATRFVFGDLEAAVTAYKRAETWEMRPFDFDHAVACSQRTLVDRLSSCDVDAKESEHEKNACQPHASSTCNTQDGQACSHCSVPPLLASSGQTLE